MTEPKGPATIETAEQLEDLLSEPTEGVVETMRRLEGDILFLGAGGKIGPSLARMARRASDLAGVSRRIIAISRFSARDEEGGLQRAGIETIRCDLLDETAVAHLPSAPNIIYLAGLKFGSSQRPAATWASNTYLPGVVCRRFPSSRIVAFSTGAVYGPTTRTGPGSCENDAPQPIGEYAMSCLGRERMFEYFSGTLNTPVALIRLFYACEMRYGILVDLARQILAGDPIDLATGSFNVIWQGDNNAMTLRAFDHVSSPPFVLNVTGREILSIREVAETLGGLLGKQPTFRGTELEMTCLGNAGKAHQLLGVPRVSASQLTEWVADWVKRGNRYLEKPTHFEVRDGRY
jgi:nucleoside-diphosphate-sugar epimerase